MTTLTFSPLIVSSCAWSIAVDEVPTEGSTPEIMQLNVPKKSQQHMPPLTVVLSVVGACLFSALVLIVVLPSVGLCVHYKKKRSRPCTSGEQSKPICEWLTRQGSVHGHLSCNHVHLCAYMGAWDCTSIPVVHVSAFICLLMIVLQVTLCIAGLHLLLPPIQCMEMGIPTMASQ